MKRVLLLLSILAWVPTAWADDCVEQPKDCIDLKPYVSMNLLYGKLKSDLVVESTNKLKYHVRDEVPGMALAFGAKISDLRMEMAVQGHTRASDEVIDNAVKGKVKNYAGFVNAYYDIPTGKALFPYVGAGLGLARNHAVISNDYVKYDRSKWSFAYQVAAGLNYALTDKWIIDLGYRYTDYGRVNVVNENNVKYKMNDIRMHNLTLGFRYEM